MKVLLIHNHYQWPGGEDFAVEQDAKLLRANRHEVVQFTDSNSRIPTMHRFSVLVNSFWNESAYKEVRRLIREERIDLVHVHNYFPLLSASVFKAADRMGVPVVHSVHNYRLLCINGLMLRDGRFCDDCLACGNLLPGVIHRCYRASFPESAAVAASIGAHRAVRTLQSSVDRFIVLSESTASKLVQGGIDRRLMAIRRNFLFSDSGAGEGGGGFVAFVGRLAHEKGVATMLDGWKRLSQTVPLKIAGDGQMASLVREFAESTASVSQLGWLGEVEVAQLLQDARFLVFPSLCNEQDPLAIIQSLCAGTPLVVSDACVYAQDFLDEGVAWVFKAGDADDLAQTVERAFNTPVAELLRMRDRARELFLRRFSADAAQKRLLEIYAEAIAERSRKQALRSSR